MKATLEFNLDDADDRMAHMRCVKALDMSILLWNIRHNLSRYITITEKNEAFYQELKEKLAEMFIEEGVNLDELIV